MPVCHVFAMLVFMNFSKIFVVNIFDQSLLVIQD